MLMFLSKKTVTGLFKRVKMFAIYIYTQCPYLLSELFLVFFNAEHQHHHTHSRASSTYTKNNTYLEHLFILCRKERDGPKDQLVHLQVQVGPVHVGCTMNITGNISFNSCRASIVLLLLFFS